MNFFERLGYKFREYFDFPPKGSETMWKGYITVSKDNPNRIIYEHYDKRFYISCKDGEFEDEEDYVGYRCKRMECKLNGDDLSCDQPTKHGKIGIEDSQEIKTDKLDKDTEFLFARMEGVNW